MSTRAMTDAKRDYSLVTDPIDPMEVFDSVYGRVTGFQWLCRERKRIPGTEIVREGPAMALARNVPARLAV